jgi:RNA polymerase sigma-70 factor (ECF subfamily)
VPRTPRNARARFDPPSGLPALARLIEDVLCAAAPAPALAAVGSPAPMQMAIGVSPSRPEQTPAGVPGVAGSSTTGAPDATHRSAAASGDIDSEHVETWRLVELAQGGDGEAFGQLYDRYVDSVYRFIFYRVNDRALAEDFTSETFLRALRRISTISDQGRDLGAWFVTIARNIVFDHMKSARHRLEISTADTPERDDHASGPEAAVIEALTSERLMAAVRQLGDDQRECIMLRFIQGFSVTETAEAMSKTEGAIKALQHRAVRKLAELVGGDLR